MNPETRRLRLPAVALAGAITLAACSPNEAPQEVGIPEKSASPTTLIVESPTAEREKPSIPEVREFVDGFTWKDLESPERRSELTRHLAEGYMQVTNSRKYTASELVEKTIFSKSQDEFRDSIERLYPNFPVDNDQEIAVVPDLSTIYEDTFEPNEVYNLINIEAILNNDRIRRDDHLPGYYLLDKLWFLWMSEDAEPFVETGVNENRGHLQNNKDFKPDNLGFEESIGYFGGSMFSISGTDLINFHLHVSSTLGSRFIMERLFELDEDYARKYMPIYEDFTSPEANQLTIASLDLNINLDRLYKAFANSDLERILGDFSPMIVDIPEDAEIDGVNRERVDENIYRGYYYARIIDDPQGLFQEEFDIAPPLSA